MEYQQAHRFATVAQREHEQAGTTVLSGAGVAHQGAGPVVDLGFFTGGGLNHCAGFRGLLATKSADEAFDALIIASEAVDVHQVLPDTLGVTTLRECQLDSFPVRLADTRRWSAIGFRLRCRHNLCRRFCGSVGGHLISSTGRI